MPVITVASNKGGVGKTAIAIELAYALGAVLLDLDHDAGAATGGWPDVGVLAPEYAKRWLEEGDGPGPRILRRDGLPDLVPSHPDYGAIAGPTDEFAARIGQFGADRLLVVDTHPGFNPLTVGAMAASKVILVPVLLQQRELRAFRGLIEEFAGYPFVTIPSRVPRWGDFQKAAVKPLHDEWAFIANQAGIPRGPLLSEWTGWSLRKGTRALLASGRQGRWVAKAQGELREVAGWIQQKVEANG